MGRYDSHKNPFIYRMNQWLGKRVNSAQEDRPKSIPCHVVKVEKDFIHVAFETANGIFTPPTVKIPQSFSRFAREPTQVGDKGYAVPGHYYLGGVSGDAGGNTDFYPRGNLTTLSFQPLSHTQNPIRNYDQLTHMGGPEGWIARTLLKQVQQQIPQIPQVGQILKQVISGILPIRSSTFQLAQTRVRKQLGIQPLANGSSGQSSSGSSSQSNQQQQQDNDQTQFSFDKNGKAIIQSKDTNHNITVDQQNKQITINVPANHKVVLGGNGKTGKYSRVVTEDGSSINTIARIG